MAGAVPEEKEDEKRTQGKEGRKERKNMREPRRAEERKSIPIQSESDKPEQCIVQTHSITQSHTRIHTRTHMHVHVEELTQTHREEHAQ